MASSVLNSDDGVISGTAGLKSVGGDDGVLVFQSKGTETARINTDKQIVAAAGTASLPALTTTGDVNTGIFFPAADTIAFGEGGAEAMRINSSGNVGIGTTNPTTLLHLSSSGYTNLRFGSGAIAGRNSDNDVYFYCNSTTAEKYLIDGAASLIYQDNGIFSFVNAASGTAGDSVSFTERMRVDANGNLLVGTTNADVSDVGCELRATGLAGFTVNQETCLILNRLGNDGTLVDFRQAGVQEGTISVSGSTVSYNGGNLSRWAQLTTPKDDTPLFKGTVMSNLDEMNVYIAPTTYWTEEDELPEGVNVGDVKVETHEVQNEQLNKVKVSDVEGDANVAGVFVNWTYDEAHQVDEINMAMTGDMIIRIAQGTTVARGDLLMSAGDGTAMPQGDDIVRSKTIAKVTSTHVTCTYDDGSYCVPCVLMAC